MMPHMDEPEDEITPCEGDLTTNDFCTFGKIVNDEPTYISRPAFRVPEDESWQDAAKRYQDARQFWGNVWRVDDHGNMELADWKD